MESNYYMVRILENQFDIAEKNSVVAVGWSDWNIYKMSEEEIRKEIGGAYDSWGASPQLRGRKINEILRFRSIKKGEREKRKMKRTRISTLFVLVITLLFSNAGASTTATLYAPDGRSIEVQKSEIAKWEAVGWVEGSKTTTVYAPDGRTATIPLWQLQSYKDVGWYDSPETIMYAPDGRSIVINISEVSSWESVGWIDGRKTTTIYAPNGSTANIPLGLLQSYKDVGWYEYPVVTMYAPDGRSFVVSKSSVAEWESVGWIDGRKKITVYAADGRVEEIPLWQLQAYKNVGWYDSPVSSICYSGTELPKFEFVTGAKCSYKNYSGTLYRYYSDTSMARQYLSYIRTYYDWKLYNADSGDTWTEYYLSKNNSYIKIYWNYLSGRVDIEILN